jgi:hypothetical protein
VARNVNASTFFAGAVFFEYIVGALSFILELHPSSFQLLFVDWLAQTLEDRKSLCLGS